jgi:hypothetical protein
VGKVKGIDIVFIRKIINQSHPNIQTAFYAKLSPEENNIFMKTISLNWVDIWLTQYFFQLAAKTLYPDLPKQEALYKIGALQAEHDFNNITFKILFRLISTRTMLLQAPKLWQKFHNQGRVIATTDESTKTGVFYIVDYPDLPVDTLQVIHGYMHYVFNKPGIINLEMVLDKSNPNAWKYTFSWK